MANTCAINGNTHKYFLFKTGVEFVPLKYEIEEETDPAVVEFIDELSNRNLYERVEYAYLGCNCGSSIKTKVKEIQYGEE